MVDQLLYRLNRVPDRIYVTFLDLIGVPLLPADAGARSTSRSGCPRRAPRTVVAAARAPRSRPLRDRAATTPSCSPPTTTWRSPPCALAHVVTQRRRRRAASTVTTTLEPGDRRSPCFSEPAGAGDALLLGLDRRGAVAARSALRFDCQVEGVGVDPTQPPLVWEAWDGTGWVALRGRPRRHRRAQPARRRRRCTCRAEHTRVGDRRAARPAGCAAASSPARERLPVLQRVPDDRARPRAFTIGGTVARACTPRPSATRCSGCPRACPGQVFPLAARPGRRRRRARSCVEVATGAGWERLDARSTRFADRDADDRHFRLDRATGDDRLRPGGARARRDAAPLRRGPAEGRAAAGAALPRRRRPRGQRRARARSGAARRRSRSSTGSRTGAAAHRRGRRRDRRRGQGARRRSRCAPATAR